MNHQYNVSDFKAKEIYIGYHSGGNVFFEDARLHKLNGERTTKYIRADLVAARELSIIRATLEAAITFLNKEANGWHEAVQKEPNSDYKQGGRWGVECSLEIIKNMRQDAVVEAILNNMEVEK